MGEFLDDEADDQHEDAYKRPRMECALTELYHNFGAWLHEGGDQRDRHLQAAIRAHSALRMLGADERLKLEGVS